MVKTFPARHRIHELDSYHHADYGSYSDDPVPAKFYR
jgi:hypothetical protein